jgi:hypothetical protein
MSVHTCRMKSDLVMSVISVEKGMSYCRSRNVYVTCAGLVMLNLRNCMLVM